MKSSSKFLVLVALPLSLVASTGCEMGSAGGYGGGGYGGGAGGYGGGGYAGGAGGGGLPPLGGSNFNPGGSGSFNPGTSGSGGGLSGTPNYTGFGTPSAGTSSGIGTGSSGTTNPLAGGGSSSPPGLGGAGTADLTAPPGGVGADDYDWRPDLKKVQVQQREWSSSRPDAQLAYVKDVMGATGNPWQPESTTAITGTGQQEQIKPSTATWVHETTHGIHSEISNANSQGGRVQSIYIETGVGAIFPEVGIPKTKAADFIAEQVKQTASRFASYVTNDKVGSPMDGNGNVISVGDATYLFDEWGAYINGSRAAIDMVKAGVWTEGNVDEVDGIMDFLYFCTAVTTMVDEAQPQYFQSEQGKAYKAAFALEAERSAKYLATGLKIPEFSGFHAGQLFHFFRSSADGKTAKLRASLVKIYGKGWTKRVFGFEQ